MQTDAGKIKILILEDSPSDAKLVQHALKKDGLQFDVLVVDSRDEFTNALREFDPNIILSDHRLASFDSKEALSLARRYNSETPFILVTGTVSEEFAVSIIKAGASDYILKGNLSRLSVAILAALSQKESKDKLRKSREQFQNTIDGMVDGVQIIGFDWKYLYVNDAVGRQGKYTKEELLGATIMEKYPGVEDTEMFRELKKCMTERVFIEMENEFTFPDGSKGWFKLNIQPAPEGVLILSTDITEKKRSIQQLEEQNRKIKEINAELDRFLYSVSHELRTPICNGLGLVNLARIISDPKEYAVILDKLEQSIKNHDRMLQSIGLFSEIMRDELSYEKINFNTLFEDCLESLKKEEGFAEVKFEVAVKGDYFFFSNRRRLYILLKNLLSNSVRFRRSHANAFAKLDVRIYENEARISVQDNGCGIDENLIPNIFKVFYKASNNVPGQGLGLYMVHKIVDMLGGKISVTSSIGKGTAFNLTLPSFHSERKT